MIELSKLYQRTYIRTVHSFQLIFLRQYSKLFSLFASVISYAIIIFKAWKPL